VIKVSKANSRAWRRAGKLRFAFAATVTVPGGTPATQKRSLKLKPPKRKR
jgi:hypothetical protein